MCVVSMFIWMLVVAAATNFALNTGTEHGLVFGALAWLATFGILLLLSLVLIYFLEEVERRLKKRA